MENYKEVDGDLIDLANQGLFDVIVQGNNCFNTQGSGLAPQFVKAFGSDTFKMEAPEYRGDINKLGTIDYELRHYEQHSDNNYKWVKFPDEGGRWVKHSCFVVNCYTQYNFGSYRAGGDVKAPADYDAITLVMRKINHIFKGKHIGLPKIGAGLVGGDWNIIKAIIQKELKDCQITIVNYKPNTLSGGKSFLHKPDVVIKIHKP